MHSNQKKFSLGKYSLIFNTSLNNHNTVRESERTPRREKSFEYASADKSNDDVVNMLSKSSLKLRELIQFTEIVLQERRIS